MPTALPADLLYLRILLLTNSGAATLGVVAYVVGLPQGLASRALHHGLS
jgi:hypothetical protein